MAEPTPDRSQERSSERLPPAKRRGAGVDPPNRFEAQHREHDFEQLAEPPDPLRIVPAEYLEDDTRSVVTTNDSPDVNFNYSLNPYRGCEHGCPYCYARPGHEFLGMNAGLDFETKIMVKSRAPELLREFLSKPGWKPEPIILSGVTDPYQPIERERGITRRCLEVLLEARQPVGILTKGTVIERDLDLLAELARHRLAKVYIAVTSLDPELQRELEPRAAAPARRLKIIAALRDVGVPTGVLMAPIIPGLTDHEMPAIMKAAAEAGAQTASYIMLRLPGAVRPVFLDWLARLEPLKRQRVEMHIRRIRNGKMNETDFGKRMRGSGEAADQVARMFKVFAKRYGLDRRLPEPDGSQFRPPTLPNGQGWLF